MLINYLKDLKNSLGEDNFKEFIIEVDRDIKINRLAYGKRTSQKEFINICENYKRALMRC